MSAKAIREVTGKRLLNGSLTTCARSKFAAVDESTNFDHLVRDNPWLLQEVTSNNSSSFNVRLMHSHCLISSWKLPCFKTDEIISQNNFVVTDGKLLFSCSFPKQKLVVKPDQLIKRRGKLGLILVNSDFEGVKKWILERISKDVQVRKKGCLIRTS